MNKRTSLLDIDYSAWLQKYSDVLVGLLLLAILGLLLLPVPPFALDLAIAANFAFSFVLLATAIYVSSPTQLASFPTLLLLTTLFRLGISIASTKMILLHAQAGDMIHAFGALVVGGSLAVGIVIFVLLTVIQLIVVSKGAERVAEVAARFTLDSIPGRQMSIDADLNAGLISPLDARARREALERETHLLGSLDGAMKFVKGDAIASIIVALVNIVGGIAVGTMTKQMKFDQALEVYSLLTIGDGLVSQLPSLVICAAAAIIMTRVSGSKEQQHLGGDMYDQIVANPKAIVMAAGACLILAAIPGFPHWQFALAALALLAVGVARLRQAKLIANSQRAPMPEMARDGASYSPRFLDDVEQGTSAPLRLRLGQESFHAVNPVALNQELAKLRGHLMQQIGMPFPGLSLQIDNGLPPECYMIDIDDIGIAQGTLYADMRLALGSAQQLAGVMGAEASRPHPGLGSDSQVLACWIDEASLAGQLPAEVTLLPADGVICAHLFELIRTHAHRLLGVQETRYLLDTLGILFPTLVTELERDTSAAALTPVLQDMLREHISIRNLRGILEAIIQLSAGERTRARMVASSRIRLAHHVVLPHLGGQQRLPVILFDAQWDAVLQDSLRIGPDREPELALHARDLDMLQHCLRSQLAHYAPHIVLLTSATLRPLLVRQLQAAAQSRTVMAIEECQQAQVALEHIATLTLEQPEHA